MSADQHTLSQGWKCPKNGIGKAHGFRIPHPQDDTDIQTHCPDQRHFQSQILPSPASWINKRKREALKSKEIISGQEIILKEPDSLWPIIISYWSNLKSLYLLPDSLCGPCWSQQCDAGATRKQRLSPSKPVSKMWPETAGKTLPQQFRDSLSRLFLLSNQCSSVLSEKANYGAKFVPPSPHFWICSFKMGRKKMTFGQ